MRNKSLQELPFFPSRLKGVNTKCLVVLMHLSDSGFVAQANNSCLSLFGGKYVTTEVSSAKGK